ncbi:thiol reductase thioredoxin [bacterium]|nr:MAG: thiol reductase thioredoxin [bacterium]
MPVGKEVDSSDFENEVTGADCPVVVDFWAPDCAPCLMIEPVLTSVGSKYEGSVKIVSVNVQKSRDLALRFGVRSIPTLLFFSGDRVVAQAIGNVGEKEILSKLSLII